jgi:hypothetical protein
MNPRLKQIIKNKLSEDFSSVSIIDYNGSIWFIDAKSKYWYLEVYKKTKTLWWRLDFFEDFFTLFGMEQNEFVPIITEWVEEVLNGKIVSTPRCGAASKRRVEEVLNCEVVSTGSQLGSGWRMVEEVLNSEIVSTNPSDFPFDVHVEEALNDVIINSTSVDTGERMRITSNGNVIMSERDTVTQKKVEDILKVEVVSTQGTPGSFRMEVEEVLKAEVVSTRRQKLRQETQVEKILNTEVVSTDKMIIQEALCNNLISKMIETTTPDTSDYFRVEDFLNSK